MDAPAPLWAEADAQELYLLRRYFQIGAHEAEHEMPRWERDLLIRRLVEHEFDPEEPVPDDPFAKPPDMKE